MTLKYIRILTQTAQLLLEIYCRKFNGYFESVITIRNPSGRDTRFFVVFKPERQANEDLSFYHVIVEVKLFFRK